MPVPHRPPPHPPGTSGLIRLLLDYDNLKPTKEKTSTDVLLNLEALFASILVLAEDLYSEAQEIEVRLYGGWIDEDGRFTQAAQWVLTALQEFRGLRRQKRFLPVLVTSPACLPSRTLFGTFRAKARPPRQKMVDALIVVDALTFCKDETIPLVLLSDDDDLVPGALAVSQMSEVRLTMGRLRSVGAALNDDALFECGVWLHNLSTRKNTGVPHE